MKIDKIQLNEMPFACVHELFSLSKQFLTQNENSCAREYFNRYKQNTLWQNKFIRKVPNINVLYDIEFISIETIEGTSHFL